MSMVYGANGLDASGVREASRLDRNAASSALRRLVWAAAGTDHVAGTAATAAEELSQLRADLNRAANRKEDRSLYINNNNKNTNKAKNNYNYNYNYNNTENRSLSASYLGVNNSRSGLKDHDREQAAGKTDSAQVRADAALAAMRKSRAASRQQAATDSFAAAEADRDSYRHEAAAAVAASTQARAELTAAKRELEQEAEAGRKLSEDASSLGQRLRRAEVEAETARTELNSQRASEASSMARLRDELQSERSRASSEAREASEAKKASQESRRLAAEAAAAASAAETAKAAEAATASSLRRSLQAVSTEVAAAKSELGNERVSAAARLRSFDAEQALNQLRVALLSRREEACRCVLSSLLAGQLESLVLGVFTAWRHVKAAQQSAAEEAARAAAAASEASNAGEATELRRQLDSLHAEAIDAQRSVAEARAASIRHESTMAQELLLARATAACLSLREEASRKVIASLLASRLVLLVRGAFHAWQHACNGEDPEKAAEELGALRRQVSDAAAAKVTAVAAREEGQAALQSSQALAEHLSVSVDDLQKKVAALEAEARQAAQLRIELQKAEEEAREVKASQRDLRCTAAMLSRRERASRTVIASLMASHMELMLQGTFCAWRDALAGNQQAEAAAKLQLAFDGSKGDLETQALELAKLQKEVSEAAKLRQQLDETAIQAAAEAGALRAELAAGKAEDSEAAKLRQQLDETASQAAAEAAALRADLAAGKAEAVAASTKSDELREECRALKSDASHLRQQIEDLEAQAAKASVVTEELAQARTEAASRSTQDARQEASRQACQVAVAEASVALLLKRERTLRHMVATLLATQLEQFLRGVWESWRSCCEGVAVSVEEIEVGQKSPDGQKRADVQEWVEVAQAGGEASQDGSVAAVTLTLLWRREQVSRAVIARLLASQLEALVHGVFSVWRELCKDRPLKPPPTEVIARLLTLQLEALVHGVFSAWRELCPKEPAEQKQALVRSVFSAWRELCKLAEQKQASSIALSPPPALLELQRTSEALRESQAAEAEARGQFSSARSLADEALGALRVLARRERATRCAYATLLASQMELVLAGAFNAWRSVSDLRQVSERSGGGDGAAAAKEEKKIVEEEEEEDIDFDLYGESTPVSGSAAKEGSDPVRPLGIAQVQDSETAEGPTDRKPLISSRSGTDDAAASWWDNKHAADTDSEPEF